jgi:hypothetical protein
MFTEIVALSVATSFGAISVTNVYCYQCYQYLVLSVLPMFLESKQPPPSTSKQDGTFISVINQLDAQNFVLQ